MAGATRRGTANDDDSMDQQALLALMDEPSRSTQPVPTGEGRSFSQATIPAPGGYFTDGSGQNFVPSPNNTGITGGMPKTVTGPEAELGGSAQGAARAARATANPAWDTDGYSAPQYTAAAAGGPMAGWDEKKWGDANIQHPKYVVGRILSQYAPTVDGLKQALPEIQKAYPGTTFNGKDKINIPGVGETDVLHGAGAGGDAWQWLDPNAAASGGSAAGAARGATIGPDGNPVSSSVAAMTQGSTYQKLLQYLNSIAGPEATDQQALLSLMQ